MTLNVHLTYDQALADLTAIVAEVGPDFIYTQVPSLRWDQSGEIESKDCAYFEPHTGAPSCGVGRVLARHGVTISDLREDQNVDTPLGGLLLDLDGFDVDDPAYRLLAKFQTDQDAGIAYGQALADAIEHVYSV